MFAPADRDRIRDAIVEAARADQRITGAALTGSAASGREDRWSDIDLAFGVAPDADFQQTIADFSDLMYQSNDAIHHLDVNSGAWVYRVFLLANTLQVDLAFAPADHFGALAPTFRLLFGTATEQSPRPKRSPEEIIGWGWLFALHVRSSLARGRFWQAEFMISGLRNQVLSLACRRHGLPEDQGRGLDDLPLDIKARLSEAFVGALDHECLSRAFVVTVEALIAEATAVDGALGPRLADALRALAS